MSPRVLAGLLVGTAIAFASPALAEPDRRDAAARAFAESTRAFDAGDYRRAAEGFESAYVLAPHEDALWNAARAWHRAGENARAANAYDRYLREAPAGARDRAAALTALKTLATKLARVELHVGAGVDGVSVDDVPLNDASVYLVPGTHVFRATTKRDPIEEQQTLKAGETTSIVLAVRAEPSTPPAPTTMPAPSPPPPRAERPSHGWSPTVVWIGGGLAVAAGAFATWSGVDTINELHAFEATPTQERLDSGRSKQLRTNVLLGSAIGVAALTGGAAIWLVDWHDASTRVAFGVATGGAALKGSF